jgi:hypothetical protein
MLSELEVAAFSFIRLNLLLGDITTKSNVGKFSNKL